MLLQAKLPSSCHQRLHFEEEGVIRAEAMITELIVRMNMPITTADIIEKKTNMTIARYLHLIKNQNLY